MKEQIERKLGCTIEEYVDILHNDFLKYKDYEIEHASYFSMLTNKELDFLTAYMENKLHNTDYE